MRLPILFSFIIILCYNASDAQAVFNKQDFQQLIQQSFDDIFSAWNTKNINRYYTNDFTILEDGKVWNKDSVYAAIRRRVSSGQQIKRVNTISVLEFKADGNSAWGSYFNEATVSVNGGPERKVKWLESAVLIKQAQGWRIRLLHSTRIKE